MLCPFQLSSSNLIGAFYETADEITLENTEISRHQPAPLLGSPPSLVS